MSVKRKTKAAAKKAPKAASASRKRRAKRSAKRAAKAAAKRAPRGRIGSSFDDYLREEGTYEETQAVAIKRVLAWRLAEEMQRRGVTKAEMARRMETSRSQLDRLLDPRQADVKLDTLARAARAVDCELRLELAAA